MEFLKKLFNSQEEKLPEEKVVKKILPEKIGTLDNSIGEIDSCPYCKKKLNPIPTRKKTCPFCEETMYSRTRPADRKKVLVTEKQKDEIEAQWTKFYEIQEENNLMQDSEFVSAEKELTKQFGGKPSLNDIKWRVYNKNIIEYASKREWGLYRNNKLNMAFLLQKGGKLRQALSTMFEVIYLDINGANNIGNMYSAKEMEEYNIKEFDPKTAFFAPGVIRPIRDLIDELSLSENETKELFTSTNKKMKPVKDMPIPEGNAWGKLFKELNIKKANAEKIEEFDAEDIDAVIKEIKDASKSKNNDTLNSIIYKFRDKYKTKKIIVPNADKIKELIKTLLNSKESIKSLGVSIMLFYIKRDKKLFSSLAEDYIEQNKKHFEKCPEDHTLGELGKIEPEWVKSLIPIMIKSLNNAPEWNTRRFIAFNLGNIGSKHPELVKGIIPILIDYLKNSLEITKRKPTKIEAHGIIVEINLSSERMLGVDQTQWLKDAYIDTLGMIAKGDKSLIEPYKKIFEKIVKKDESEYSRKKSQKVLDILR